MKTLVVLALAAVAALGTASLADASTTTVTASPRSAIVGQKVTFTAKFTPSCSGTVASYYFTIDGKKYNGTYVRSGQNRTETLSLSTLKAGTHAVVYQWQVTASCKGTAALSYVVAAKTTPSPTPAGSPSPSALPSPSPSPVELVAQTSDQSPLAGYIGGGLILFAVVAGLVLAVTSRR